MLDSLNKIINAHLVVLFCGGSDTEQGKAAN